MALYTGKGDGGTTKLFSTPSGVRLSKGDAVFEALGKLDSLNSFLGLCSVKSDGIFIGGVSVFEILRGVQETLFIAQAEVAGSDKRVLKESVEKMEGYIEKIEDTVGKITTFTISGGTEISALLDITRTMARDAERAVIRSADVNEISIGDHLKVYLNRLSSLLYALARGTNKSFGVSESSPHY